jgi:homoserine kinase
MPDHRNVRVVVPASTANLGPGFDCLGLALSLHNEVELSLADSGLRVENEGEGASELPTGEENLIVRAARRLFEHVGKDVSGLHVRAVNRIPLAAGLGSSAATVVGALVAADRLVEAKLDQEQLLRLAYEMEGHVDNAAASLFGGLVLVAPDGPAALTRRVEIPPPRVVVTTPEFGLSTGSMREALPAQVPFEDAVFNMGRALMVVEALRTADYALLAAALRDRLHQSARSAHIRGYADVVSGALSAGASGAAISGAGPSLIAFAPSAHEAIAGAMVDAWRAVGIGARARILDVAPQGARVARSGGDEV